MPEGFARWRGGGHDLYLIEHSVARGAHISVPERTGRWAGLAVTAFAASGKIAGTVVSSETGRGVAGAVVTITGTTISATTNLEGAYTLENVPEGVRDVAATREGYRPVNVTGLSVVANETTRTDLPLATVTIESVLKMEAFSVTADAS